MIDLYGHDAKIPGLKRTSPEKRAQIGGNKWKIPNFGEKKE